MGQISFLGILGRDNCDPPCIDLVCDVPTETGCWLCLDTTPLPPPQQTQFTLNQQVQITIAGFDPITGCPDCISLNGVYIDAAPQNCRELNNTPPIVRHCQCSGTISHGGVCGGNPVFGGFTVAINWEFSTNPARVKVAIVNQNGEWGVFELIDDSVIEKLCNCQPISLPRTSPAPPTGFVGCKFTDATVTFQLLGCTPQPCTPPTVDFTQTPPEVTPNTSATFVWDFDGTVDFQFGRLDGGSEFDLFDVTTFTFPNLQPGQHTFRVRVWSNCGEDIAEYTWVIGTCDPPTIELTQTPPATTNNTTAFFAWETTGTVLVNQIRLDNGPFQDTGGPNFTYNNLTTGSHTVEIRVSNNCGLDLVTYSWFITGSPPVPPTVTLTQTPPSSTTDTNAPFAWTTTGQIDTTTCQLDSLPASSCSTPTSYTVAPGQHTFRVTVANTGGSDTEVYSWEVINPLPPPTVTLTQVPPLETTDTTATFGWTTTGQIDYTECQLDNGPIQSCSTPTTYNNLSVGIHTFSVTVRNQAGQDTETYSWEVITPGVAPTVTLTETPPAQTQDTTATFAWTTTGQVDTTTCQLDNNPPSSCSTPTTYNNLAVGLHEFRVTVANQFGSDVEIYNWEVTQQPPVLTLCEKIVQLFHIANNVATVDVDVTISGVTTNNPFCEPHWNRTYLFPGNFTPTGACDLVNLGKAQTTQPCGDINVNGNQPTINWRICMACNTGSPIVVTGPVLHVWATFPDVSTGAPVHHWHFTAGGAQLEPLIDQMLATGQGVVPFHSQTTTSTVSGFFNFANATCTFRVS